MRQSECQPAGEGGGRGRVRALGKGELLICLLVFVPAKRFLMGDHLCVVGAHHARPIRRLLKCFLIGKILGANHAVECAMDTQFLGQRSRIDTFNARDAVGLEVVINDSLERQLLTTGDNSRTTKPETCGW